jgi:hypothetical protein
MRRDETWVTKRCCRIVKWVGDQNLETVEFLLRPVSFFEIGFHTLGINIILLKFNEDPPCLLFQVWNSLTV